MTETPSNNPDPGLADEPEETIQEQIDRLLLKIEAQDPGPVRTQPLPADAPPQPASAEPDQPFADTAQDETAEAVAQFEQAIETAEPPQQADEPMPAAAPAPAPTDGPANTAEGEMLASINNALEEDGTGQPEPNPPADTQGIDNSSPGGTEAQLQAEIAALLDADPQAQVAEPAPTAATESVQDQIADEIEGLLNAEPQQQATADPETPTAGDPSIDQLDQMLADEIDADDELAGDFQSVQDVTAGIEIEDASQGAAEDTHAASAHDVAAELDSQPEDLPQTNAPPGDMGDDPLAAIAAIAEVAETNQIAYQEQVAGNIPGWRGRLIRARKRLYRFCYTLNWPARELLSTENRANLGYVALMVLVSAVALWAYVILL